MLRIKVCGLAEPDNANEILALNPDFFGLNFYNDSPRFVYSRGKFWPFIKDFPESVATGVFVNADASFISEKTKEYTLRAVQLHGNEAPDDCESLKKKNLIVIKAFSISGPDDFKMIESFKKKIDFCLFDTRTDIPGGSGRQFDWKLLKNFRAKIPFFLSGGISEEDVDALAAIRHPMFYGIDINSKFETYPGRKDAIKIKKFIHDIHSRFSHLP